MKDKNKNEQSKSNRSFVIGKSSMTITRKSINIQTPKLILHQQKQNSENRGKSMEKEEMKTSPEALSDITKIVVETDEKDSKTIAVITADDIDSAEGFRVRITPKYD